jgi:hydrogenase nickel incorporation protein HypA/HybF
MHEFSIALNIVDIASKTAKEANAEKIKEVEIDVGVLSGVILEALRFALYSAIKGTLLENAEFKINEIPAKVKCNECNTEFEPDNYIAQCPECNSFNYNFIQGRELRVKSISVD